MNEFILTKIRNKRRKEIKKESRWNVNREFDKAEVFFRNKTLLNKFLFIFHLSVSETMSFASRFELAFKLFN